MAGQHQVAEVSDVHMRCDRTPHRWTHKQADAVDAVGLANARLIAQAPALLDSCKELREAFAAALRWVASRGLEEELPTR